MNPRLVCIAGSLKGTIFALTDDQTTIGRDSSNQLSVRDRLLSRQHCRIAKETERFTLTDLDSLNGTFINNVPIKKRQLANGDHIKLGKSVFIFLLNESEAQPPTNSVLLSDESLLAGVTVELRHEDALYLDAEKVQAALNSDERTARDLNTLLKISAAINASRNLPDLQRQLLELLAEAVPARSGAILLVNNIGDDFTSTYGWRRSHKADREVSISRTIAFQVLRDGRAVLRNEVLDSKELAESLVSSQTHSLLAVPMMLYEKTVGIIYLATSSQFDRFDEHHLQLVMAAAHIAALAIENLLRVEWLENENERLQSEIELSHNMIGESPRMREVYHRIARVAPTDATVLIRGESGTGKELAARAIHQNSQRANKPFVAINCAALTETLLESELFGHEKGAFTGAYAQKKGKLEIAQSGTLFLDEVGEMTPLLQAKLLRVLQEHEFERVGGTHILKADIRLIAATNRNLEKAIQQGGFREDLYYRLNVVTLLMPPLRERREDIPLLASYFAMKHGDKCKRQIRGIMAEARAALMAYDWHGNVRELENAIERAVVLGSGDFIQPEDLPEVILETESTTESVGTKYHQAVKEAKKQLILQAFDEADGNYTEAAHRLGVHPNYLHRLIRNLNIKPLLKK